MSKNLLREAIAEAAQIREAAILNAKEVLHENLTPHIKDMLAMKLREMDEEDAEPVEEGAFEGEDGNGAFEGNDVVGEAEEGEEEGEEELEGDEIPEDDELPADDDSVESEEGAEDEEMEVGEMTVDALRALIQDAVAQAMGGGQEELGGMEGEDDLEGELSGEIPGEEGEEGLEGTEDLEGSENDDDEIDLSELLAELNQGPKKTKKVASTSDASLQKQLNEALNTIKQLSEDLKEVNLFNAKLLYLNKVLKASTLSESKKVDIITAFDQASSVKEAKLVYETITRSLGKSGKTTLKEQATRKGFASKPAGKSTRGQIVEIDEQVNRWQKLAGIKRN